MFLESGMGGLLGRGGGCILRVRHGLLGKCGNKDDRVRWQQVLSDAVGCGEVWLLIHCLTLPDKIS